MKICPNDNIKAKYNHGDIWCHCKLPCGRCIYPNELDWPCREKGPIYLDYSETKCVNCKAKFICFTESIFFNDDLSPLSGQLFQLQEKIIKAYES